MATLGKQYIITLEQCSHAYVNDPDLIIATITSASLDAGLHILSHMEHRFEPQGLTFMLLLSQSHLLVHTWPEFDTMIIDVFVCTLDINIEAFVEKLVGICGAGLHRIETVIFEQTATAASSNQR